MQLLKREFGVSWLLVFRHKTIYKSLNNSFNEDLLRYSTEENRYSLLGNINNSFKYNGMYEFLLEYPEIEGYNRWRQRKNPFTARPNENIGYQKINCTWEGLGWGGIARSDSGYSLLDGTPKVSSNYYFAIGLNSSWGNYSIPGPFTSNQGIQPRELLIWIRTSYTLCTVNSKMCESKGLLLGLVIIISK